MPTTADEIHEPHSSYRRRPPLRGLPDAAWDGDEEAFRRLVQGQRAALQSHCHRMLGTVHDAEDAFQETMLRAWRGLPTYQGRSSLRSWLYRIATNVCIDAIGRRPKRELPDSDREIEDGAPAPPARCEQRETIELAFIAALNHLPARQRATLILMDVMGFSAKEVAVILETTVAAANSALQRARAGLNERLLERSEQAALRSLEDTSLRDVVQRLADAFERADIGAILVLLSEDPTSMHGARRVKSKPAHDRRRRECRGNQ